MKQDDTELIKQLAEGQRLLNEKACPTEHRVIYFEGELYDSDTGEVIHDRQTGE